MHLIFWIKVDKSSHSVMIGEAQLPGDVMIGLSRQPRQAACMPTMYSTYYISCTVYTTTQTCKCVYQCTVVGRVSVQGVRSLGGHFACWFDFYEVEKKKNIIIFQKEKENTFTLLIIIIQAKVFKREKQHKSTTMTPNLLE